MQRRYRLRERERFQSVRRRGRSWAHPLIVLCALPNQLAISRFGFAAGRRIGNAVERNRAKRRMREAVRRQMAGVMSGWDLVFIARPPLNQAHFVHVQRACRVLLKRALLYRLSSGEAVHRDEDANTGSDPCLPEGDFPPSAT